MPLYELLSQELQVVREAQDRIMKDLYGNGREGLKTEVTRLRQAVRIATVVAVLIASLILTDYVGRATSSPSPDETNEVRTLQKSNKILKGVMDEVLLEVRNNRKILNEQ